MARATHSRGCRKGQSPGKIFDDGAPLNLFSGRQSIVATSRGPAECYQDAVAEGLLPIGSLRILWSSNLSEIPLKHVCYGFNKLCGVDGLFWKQSSLNRIRLRNEKSTRGSTRDTAKARSGAQHGCGGIRRYQKLDGEGVKQCAEQ